MTKSISQTNFPKLKFLNRGKVRDLYAVRDHLLLVATDRISAFDVIMPNPIPGKGVILNKMSAFWFKQMEDIIGNHIVSTNPAEFPEECAPYRKNLEGRSMLVKKATPLPVECIVRGYLSGSGWKDGWAAGSVAAVSTLGAAGWDLSREISAMRSAPMIPSRCPGKFSTRVVSVS